MTHSNDSQRPHRTRRQFTTAALVLLAGVGWAKELGAADVHGGSAAAPGKIGAGPVLALAIDPDTPTTLYAGTECSGVLKSLDGGDSWSAVNSGLTSTYVRALAIDPSTPTTLYAGTAVGYERPSTGGVFKSLNGGSSWSAVNTGLPDNPPVWAVTALAINPTTPATLYAGTLGDGVFRSLNGAGSWNAVNTGLTNDPTHQYVYALAINPTTPATLYAGTSGGVFRSLNGGSSWSDVNSGLPEVDAVPINALAIDPSTPTTLYAGIYRGVLRSRNGGSSWSEVNTGLTNPYGVSVLAIDPTTPTTLYAGAPGNEWLRGGVFKSLNGGSSWQATSLTDWDVSTLAINPATPTTLYAGTGGGVFKSLNGGSSWQATGLGGVVCGDGFADCIEVCDDGGESATCDADCSLPQCGDGTLNVTAGEQCDDGNRNPSDGCTNDCTVCGNGVVTPPEECDDGNTSSDGNCDAQCRRPRVVGTGTPQSCTEAAFDAALSERSVRFNCGPAPVAITVTSEKAITAATTIDGGGRITLSGGGAVRIFTVDASTGLELRNLTIADARPAFDVLSGNQADYGGGINNAGTLMLTNCTLRGNSAAGGYPGGGIANFGTLTLMNCSLSGNSGDAGGGIYNQGGTLTLTNCTLSGNSALGVGGWWGNGSGGGIYNLSRAGGPLTLTNCTLSGNSAVGSGGGIYNGGTAQLVNGTLSENGGAITNVCLPVPFGGCSYEPVTLTNTIIAESARPSCSGGDPPPDPARLNIIDGGHNIQFSGTSCGETILSLDPLLDPAGLKDNGGPTQTIALLPGSPAIDAGDPEVCANPPVNGVDQRGYIRPGTGFTNCAIGAYEYNSPGPPAGSVCGDGVIRTGAEQCDDGNTTDGDGCDSNCTVTACGNGVRTAGEECDDGNLASGDGCSDQCRSEFCGDRVVQAGLGEQCDDGGFIDGDGCDSNCTVTTCGNGVRTAGEECDDHNTIAGDCCSSACRVEAAGAPCFDGNVCDGTGRCDGSGSCEPETGTPLDCDDGKPQTFDFCDALHGCRQCTGECNRDGEVTVDELLTMVRIALGAAAVSECPAGDGNQDGTITIGEIVAAVKFALDGCAGG